MEISKYERLTLYNQYKILEKLSPKEAEYYRHCQEILTSGYVDEYSDLITQFGEFTAEQSSEVRDVLHMYDMLNLAYSKLKDKSGINATALSFVGFDGNGEGGRNGYMGYVQFLHRRGLFKSILADSEGGDFNSHWPMLPTYRTMLQRFNASDDPLQLTKADIVRIVTGLARA